MRPWFNKHYLLHLFTLCSIWNWSPTTPQEHQGNSMHYRFGYIFIWLVICHISNDNISAIILHWLAIMYRDQSSSGHKSIVFRFNRKLIHQYALILWLCTHIMFDFVWCTHIYSSICNQYLRIGWVSEHQTRAPFENKENPILGLILTGPSDNWPCYSHTTINIWCRAPNKVSIVDQFIGNSLTELTGKVSMGLFFSKDPFRI